jgi:hypothetical protein
MNASTVAGSRLIQWQGLRAGSKVAFAISAGVRYESASAPGPDKGSPSINPLRSRTHCCAAKDPILGVSRPMSSTNRLKPPRPKSPKFFGEIAARPCAR